MARSSKNTDLVPKEVIDELINLDKQLEETKDNLVSVLKPVIELSNTFQSTATGTAALTKAIRELSNAEARSNEPRQKAINILREIERAKARLKALQTEEGKMLAKAKEDLRLYNVELKSQAKESLAASNSIEAMRVNVSRLKQEWAKADLGSETFQKLSKDLAEANAKLIEAESNVGIFGRNVGNYKSAFNGLNCSVQQIARELPSLSIGLSQFFLAISNNIPILVDDINKAKAANAALAAEGKKGVPIFKQLASSIFSWQTLLVVGVTLLTVYGKDIQEFFTRLIKGKDAIGDINKEINKNISGLGKDVASVKKLQSQWNALGNDLNAKKKFIEENKDAFHDLGVEVENVGDAENLLVKNTDVFIQSLTKRAQATAAMKLAEEKYEEAIKKQLEIEEEIARGPKKGSVMGSIVMQSYGNSIDPNRASQNEEFEKKAHEDRVKRLKKEKKEILDSANSIITASNKLENEGKTALELAGIKTSESSNTKGGSTDKIAEFRKELAEREARAEIDGKQYQLKEGAELNKEIYRDELNSYEERIKAADDYTRAMKESIEARAEAQKNDLIRDAAIGLGLDPDKDRVEAEKYVAKQIEVINMKKNVELEKMDRRHSEIVKDIWEENVKQAVQATVASLNNALAESTGRENEAMKALNEQFIGGSMSNEKYEIEKNKIAEQYAQERIQIQINELEKRLEIEGLSEADRLALTKKIADLELKEEQIKSDKEIEIEKKTNEARKQLAEEAYKFINQLVMQNFESKIKALEEESEKNDEWREEELARIERFEEAGALSKEQADARKAVIDDQAKLREKELERQKKEILRKQARYEKTQALASVGINIAQAITATLAKFGMPLATSFITAVSTLGAIQTASILSTPIPEYAEGTKDHPGGLAVVGDGGKSEMVIANGRIFKTPSTDTLVELPKHAIVLPDFAAALENKVPMMDKTDKVISFQELSDLMREGNNKTERLLKTFNRQIKNQLYERELNKVRRITR